MTNRVARWAWRAGLTVALIVAASPAGAQNRCGFLCAPDFKDVSPFLGSMRL